MRIFIGKGSSKNLASFVDLARPDQWQKNLMVLLSLVFSERSLSGLDAPKLAWLIGAFICASSSIYALNDVIDSKADKSHPVKRFRPIASGKISKKTAIAASGALFVIAVGIGFIACRPALYYILGYLFLQVMYCLWLKRVSLVDICCIAAGFALRVGSGAAVMNIPLSTWFLSSVVTLSFFLALGKRRAELQHSIASSTVDLRRVNRRYSLEFLNGSLVLTATSGYLFYCVWVFIVRPDSAPMMVSTLLALVATLRYMQLLTLPDVQGQDQSLASVSRFQPERTWQTGERPDKDAFSDFGIRLSVILIIALNLVSK